MLISLFTEDLTSTRDLFVDLLDFEVEFESDWFISMARGEGDRIAAMSRTSEFIPAPYQQNAQGIMVSIIVDDADRYFEKALTLNLTIIEEPRDLPYGQRRFLVLDASGALVDVSAPTAPLDNHYQ